MCNSAPYLELSIFSTSTCSDGFCKEIHEKKFYGIWGVIFQGLLTCTNLVLFYDPNRKASYKSLNMSKSQCDVGVVSFLETYFPLVWTRLSEAVKTSSSLCFIEPNFGKTESYLLAHFTLLWVNFPACACKNIIW